MLVNSQQLLTAMGQDNGCTFTPCKRHEKDLDAAVQATMSEGLSFTPDDVDTLAYGEETEQQNIYKRFPSGKKLNKALNDIFDNCRACKSQ